LRPTKATLHLVTGAKNLMNSEITDDMLRNIMPNRPAAKRQLYLP
jgi:hypothetical protein